MSRKSVQRLLRDMRENEDLQRKGRI